MRCALLLVAWLLSGLAAAMPSLDLANAAQLARAGACIASAIDPAATALYQSAASASGVDGNLKKYALTRDQAGRPVPAGAPAWDAAVLLESHDPALRALYTGQREGERWRTVPLDWTALDRAGQSLLSTGAGGVADGEGASRLAYLRGARAMETGFRQGRFRHRASLLGASVVGAPLFVGPPAPAGADPRYQAFQSTHANRPAAVYLQANDSMVHGFDAASGGELFAYLPLALRPRWPRLPTAAYAASPYAEGGLAAGNALVRGAWKTVLAGALGSGAQGVFALDISNPARFASGDGVLFEFTDGDDPDMGNLFHPPALARFRTGAGQYGDFIVVASGYNSHHADGEGRSNPAGPGALFLLSLDKDPAAPWQQNRNYFKFLLPAGSAALPNGLGQPALIAHTDGSVRLAYAGDLQGRLWRLDFSAGQPPWPQATGSGQPLFVAADASGRRQPITSAPRALYRPDGGLLLLFGTGRLLEGGDAQDKSVQSLYAVADGQAAATLARADLAVRKLVADKAGAYRLDGGTNSSAGWVLDFPVPGERLLASPLVEDGIASIVTMLPGAASCAANGSLYLLNAQNGLSPLGVTAPWLAVPM
ncbi:pilus assembly protein PilY|uniref:pilus assembly protein n=1 Tax=Noviherbaspirillum sp. L7-7A TaxID=2850560 RepID=UPI001C2C68F1|nr:PilC/PilY family type IV pilus protein [Noviherbaspirillum sp. L7-7A]MBV0880059.1 pilus assembly protein PilY [Noviherbaspirillum sp. L7-7A]